jgi:subtilase family serine protease
MGAGMQRAKCVASCMSIAGILAFLVAVAAGSAQAASSRARVGDAAPRPLHAAVLGRAASAQRLRLTVELAPRDPLALRTFAASVSSPGNADYHHFLTVGQFAHRFAAPRSHVVALSQVLRRDGLAVGRPSRNEMELPVSGSVGLIERVFAVAEQRVRTPNGRIAYFNRQAPTLPSALAQDVQAVLGLDDLAVDQPAGLARPKRSATEKRGTSSVVPEPDVADGGGPQPCVDATDAGEGQPFYQGVTADGAASVYGFENLYDQGDFGSGRTVALVEFEGFDPDDVAQYQACYGTDAQVSTIDVDGGPDDASPDDEEAALDIEQVIGLAPDANIQVFQGPDVGPTDVLNAIVSLDSAQVISMSWGFCEEDESTDELSAVNLILEEAAAQGQSFFASSGDYGSSTCYQTDGDDSLSVIDPGAQPFATSVGGTFLYGSEDDGSFDFGPGSWYTPGTTPAESVWNDGPTSASGGGISSSFAMPDYQSAAASALGVVGAYSSSLPCGASTDCREIPDVSADAAPESGYDVYATDQYGNDGWEVIGGTSASAPLWAAFTALADGLPACHGLPLGFLNPALYALAGSSYASDFTDISADDPLSGADSDDGFSITGGDPNGDLYPVTPGYDMATGLGSMVAGTLGPALCTARTTFTVSVASPGIVAATTGQPVSIPITATDSGAAVLSFSAAGLPAGLSIDPSTGAISGTPEIPGVSTVTVAAQDAYGNSASTQFTLTVASVQIEHLEPQPVARPSARRLRLTRLTSRRPVLTFLASGGSGRVESLTVELPRGFSFARRARALGEGISVHAGRVRIAYSATASRDRLRLKLGRAESAVTVFVTRPALAVTRREIQAIGRRRVRAVVLRIAVSASDGLSSRQRITVRRLR